MCVCVDWLAPGWRSSDGDLMNEFHKQQVIYWPAERLVDS
jgi:hypothetical protein